MKKILGLACIMLIAFGAAAVDEKIVNSSLSQVTVYSQGAQIYRTASYSVSKGVTEVIIDGVSSQIDANSLQVKATGNVIILDSKYNLFYPKPESPKLDGLPLKIRQDIMALEDSIFVVNYELQTYQDEIDVLMAAKSILANNGAIRGQGKVNDSIALLKEAIDYYTIKMMEVNKKIQVLNRYKTKKSKVREGMNARLIDLQNYQNSANLKNKPKGPSYRITITLKSNDFAKGKLDVSYLVSGAGWTPVYDLRSEPSTGKINLNYKAQVYQNTGIDWEDVRLNISTNNPYQNKTKPSIHPWYIDYNMYRSYNTNQDKDRRARSSLEKKAEAYGYTAGAPTAVAEDAEMDAMTANQFVQIVEHMISAEFRIDLPYSIKSNNQQHMVLVKNVDLDADYKYYSVPKFDQSAYLVAQITNLDELQLVPAKANIFFDGTYMGETYIDPTSMNDTLNLSLGKDPNIIVKRTLLKKECKDKVVGTKHERTSVFAIEVKNMKSTSIEIVIQDQIPVTSNPEIEIEVLEVDKGTLDKRTGIVEWKFNLKPKASKDIQFGYKVKHDKDKIVPLN
jgi:uncharacterized protein (TIGR02231 family)